MNDHAQDKQGFQFPCEYQVKAQGLAEPGFADLIAELVRDHCPEINAIDISERFSRTGKYVSISVRITALSMDHLNAIYASLDQHEKVLARL